MGLLGGIGRVLKSPLTYRKANRIIREAKERFEMAEEELEAARIRFQKVLEDVGKKKLNISAKLLAEVEEKLSEVRGNLNFTENKIAKEEQRAFEEYTAPAVKNVSMSAKEILATGLKMGGTGTAAFAGAVGIASYFGVASTGTAITSLSGAAAANATLAWFGGGAIGAGGAGMATGAVVLGGIALAPVLIIGALKFASHAEKKLTAAEEFSAQVDVAIEKINAIIETTQALEKHFLQFDEVLEKLSRRLKGVLKTLWAQHQNGHDTEGLERSFFAAVLLTKSIKRLLEVNLLSEDGLANQEARLVIEHAQYSQQEHAVKNQVVDSVVSNAKVVKPEGVKRVDDIPPGKDSVLYFWLHGAKSSFNWKGFLVAAFACYAIVNAIRIFFF